MNLLFSFAHMSSPSVLSSFESALNDHTVLLDSGAFTIHNTKKSITIEDYASFLKVYGRHVWRYINFDKIGSTIETEENYKWLKGRGHHPTPVLQPTLDLEKITRFNDQHDYFCLGGLAKYDLVSVRKYLHHIGQVIDFRKTHILGKTVPGIIERFLPGSCDSSSWYICTKFGRTSILTKSGIKQVPSNKSREVRLSETLLNYRKYADLLTGKGVKLFFTVSRAIEYDLLRAQISPNQ